MTTDTTEPINQNWSPTGTVTVDPVDDSATAADVCRRLGRLDVADIAPELVPFMAAAAAELALVSGIAWRFSTDDAPVALMRVIAKVGIRQPDATGPHTDRLHAELG